MATSFSQFAAPVQAANSAQRRRYLLGPISDFLTFGGLSLLVLPAMLLLLPATAAVNLKVWTLTMLLAHVINHPHFAHSYQLFYRQFAEKASGRLLGSVMRARYLFAGVAVPLALAVFLAVCFARGDRQLLGYAGNVMALFVGWHYVKQGYGLLMTDCALKRQFFGALDKRVLLINCYVAWAAAWLMFNADAEKSDLFGISTIAFAVPGWLVNAAIGVLLATTLAVAVTFLRNWRVAGTLPFNGVLAYVASLYPWLILIKVSPMWVALAPAFHSLQYLAVVWRFEINRESAQLAQLDPAVRSSLSAHIARFIGWGIVLGLMGFWVLPMLANTVIGYDHAVLGTTFFLFAAWIFINVHHYFIDNVIWRRDNPETQRFLFS